MRIFNEETEKPKGAECLILISWEEVRMLNEIVDAGIKANPRKRSWKKMLDKLELLAVY